MAPEEVLLPNGMDWDEGRGVVYFVDSGVESIVAYQTDAQVSARRTRTPADPGALAAGVWSASAVRCGAVRGSCAAVRPPAAACCCHTPRPSSRPAPARTAPQGIPRRGADGALEATTVSHVPTSHKHVPDGMTLDAGVVMHGGLRVVDEAGATDLPLLLLVLTGLT